MPASTDFDGKAAAQRLESRIREQIPLARDMDVRVVACTGATLEMRAPLAPNVNDKGCAFGGSLGGLMTLAGWGLVVLALERIGCKADVYVADTRMRYMAPLYGELCARAQLAGDGSWDLFAQSMRASGKGRVQIYSEVAGEHGPCTEQHANFVAKAQS